MSLPTSKSFDDESLIQRVWDTSGELFFDEHLFNYIASTVLQGLKSGWNIKGNIAKLTDAGFIYGFDDPALISAYELNLFHFSAGKTLAEIQELNRLFRQSKDFQTFYTNAKLKTEVFNKTWMETEYNTSVLTGEAAATYHRLMAQVEIFPYWEYRTVGDDKVRAEHRALEGLILPANDKIWKKIFPPNGWNCRCYIVPRTRKEVEGKINIKEMRKRAYAFFDSSEYKRASAQGWGVNRAEAGEVFTANQMYIRKFQGVASKKLGELFYTDYKLKPVSKMTAEANETFPVYEGAAFDWFEQRRQGEQVTFTDYKGRKPVLSRTQFESHTEGSRENRTKYLSALEQAISHPDEVWISNFNNTQKLNNYVYVKYYEGKMMIVVSRLENLKLEVRTWFEAEMAIDETLKQQIAKAHTLVKKRMLDPKWKFRRGLLIKTKP